MSSHYTADPECVESMENGKKKIYKPRGLSYVWGNESKYWKIPKKEEKGAAELIKICWLEVTGEATVTPGKYQIGFRVSFKTDASGWNQAPLFISAKVGNTGKTTWKRIKSLKEKLPEEEVIIPGGSDGQLEVTVPATGDISTGTKLYFGLYEVWTGKWKTGLMIHEAFVQQVP